MMQVFEMLKEAATQEGLLQRSGVGLLDCVEMLGHCFPHEDDKIRRQRQSKSEKVQAKNRHHEENEGMSKAVREESVNSQNLRNFPSGSLGGRVGSHLGVFFCLSLG